MLNLMPLFSPKWLTGAPAAGAAVAGAVAAEEDPSGMLAVLWCIGYKLSVVVCGRVDGEYVAGSSKV